MNESITAESLLRALPDALANDENMKAIGQTIAGALFSLAGKTREAAIYNRIDELSGELLDILARDFKVDWYDYNAPLSAKRRLIRDSFFVHRHLGTKAALETALSDIHPSSKAMEWFEYGGEPYFFRIVCDLTQPYNAFRIGSISNAIELYKPVRSRLEENSIILQSRGELGARMETKAYAAYYPLCGTMFCGV